MKGLFQKLFINPSIGLLFLGQVISQGGDSMFQIALIWMVLELTGSQAMTGFMASLSYLPFLFLALPAGIVADHYYPKNILLGADALRAFLVILIPILYYAHNLSLLSLGTLAFLIASGAAFFNPTRDSLISHIAPDRFLPHANALIQTSWQFAVLLGPALAALLIPAVGIVHLFTVDSLTFLLSFLCILRILGPPPRKEGEPIPSLKESFHGFKILFTYPFSRTLLLVTILNNLILMGPAIVGVPFFVRNVLGLGASHYAWVEASLAGGILVGAPLIATWGKSLPMGKLLLWGIVLDGITYLPLFWVKVFSLTVVTIFFHSIFIPMVTVSRTTLIQRHVPPELRGRMFSLIQMAVIGGTALSSTLTGLLAEHVPMPYIYLFMAPLAGLTSLPGFLSQSLRKAR